MHVRIQLVAPSSETCGKYIHLLVRREPKGKKKYCLMVEWKEQGGRTAFNSPRFPFLAKCALRLALALPAHTPHSERRTLENEKTITRNGLGKAGDRQSSIMALSLNMSAARRYILHSGSRDVPSLWANRIVTIRPMDSCSTLSKRAAVGEAFASPTPTPVCRDGVVSSLFRV